MTDSATLVAYGSQEAQALGPQADPPDRSPHGDEAGGPLRGTHGRPHGADRDRRGRRGQDRRREGGAERARPGRQTRVDPQERRVPTQGTNREGGREEVLAA